jgi:uncharacterized RDD family membrane protein YckC
MDERLDTTATIETPERVTFRFRLAGPAQRGIAWFIDSLVIGGALAIVGLLSAALLAIPGFKGLGTMGGLIAFFFLQWFYGLFFEWLMHGRTPGKVAMLLRVVREDGAPAGFQDLFLRNLLRGVDALPILGGVGVLVMALDPKMRRIGDLAGGTVVVSEERATLHAAVLIAPPVSEEERQAMPARIPLARHEIALIEVLIRRRRQLTEERMEELAALFGPKLTEQTGLEAPTWRRVLVLAYARATGRDRSP